VASGTWLLLPATMVACTTVLDYGPERRFTKLPLYRQSFEATSGSGRCDAERPEVRAGLVSPTAADCDHAAAALEGAQSLHVKDEGEVACDPCWTERPDEVWSSFALRMDGGTSFIGAVFALASEKPTEDPPYLRQAGPVVSWGPEPFVRLFCDDVGSVDQLPLPVGKSARVLVHYDWRTNRGELWVGELSAAPTPSMPPGATIKCRPSPQPSSWYARGLVKPQPGQGSFTLDDLVVADAFELLSP
jgi:hypothetical protein